MRVSQIRRLLDGMPDDIEVFVSFTSLKKTERTVPCSRGALVLSDESEEKCFVLYGVEEEDDDEGDDEEEE